METLSVSAAAALLGVSDDTVRRWVDAGRLAASRSPRGRLEIDGRDLARLAQELAASSPLAEEFPGHRTSSRNRITGIVTAVTRDTVMAQVELQAGPFRVVSLLSREAADELGLEPGVVAAATVKATNVSVELPG
ncbi:helix-turn-helix transcriptional regulator [Galbitalea sp. SE-J8]|uniref:TOBE domain-containing protein n=1 Tax=Galbitalea sp. SE-J8 TaxID=3054952 RepID=UPI00259CD527|nr:helix-turn-helix transcriptional regulator [Galbitalea sp. SE-J8]MDM4763703.1 helix-turn-helix transcriptional regulator [Galbitalea sp. SE-J8]